MQERVGGTLAVTRSFGDLSLSKLGVVATPYIKKYVLRPFDKYLIIASDGLWDVTSDLDSVKECKETLTTKVIA